MAGSSWRPSLDDSEYLSPNTIFRASPSGRISDQLANQRLDVFIEATHARKEVRYVSLSSMATGSGEIQKRGCNILLDTI